MKPRIHPAVMMSVAALAIAACSVIPRAQEPEPPLVPAARATGSKAELVTRCGEQFRVTDKDRDRQVTLEELADRLDQSLNADLVFRQRDRDMDGLLNEREFCARLGATIIVTPSDAQ